MNINFKFFISFLSVGNITVPVANCDEKYYNVQKTSGTQLCDYLKYWQDYTSKSYSGLPCLYLKVCWHITEWVYFHFYLDIYFNINLLFLFLKDWHFTQDFPEENMYRVPKYFASDWLNEYYSEKTGIKDDYRFVYMGPQGSW